MPWRDVPPDVSEGVLVVVCELDAGSSPLSVALMGTWDTSIVSQIAVGINISAPSMTEQVISSNLSPMVALHVAGGSLTNLTASAWFTPKRD